MLEGSEHQEAAGARPKNTFPERSFLLAEFSRQQPYPGSG